MAKLTIEQKIEIINNSQSLEQITLQALPDVHSDEYYFVSYSHLDYKEVYSDILHLQQHGVNIWYDRGLPAGLDWEEMAEEYISKFNCIGVIFYLSENALKSDAILTEIKKVREYGKDFLSVVLPVSSGPNAGKVLSPTKLLQIACPNISAETEKFKVVNEVFGDKVIYLSISADASQKAEKIRLLQRPDEVSYALNEEFGSVTLDTVHNRAIRRISIPDAIVDEHGQRRSVLGIGACAFAGCGFLQSVEFASYFFSLNDYTFIGCTKLKDFERLNSVSRVGLKCFYGCSQLPTAYLVMAKYVGARAFGKCTSLTNVFLGKRLAELGEYCFEDCTSLQKLEFENQILISELPEGAFFRCTSLKSVEIPQAVEQIGEKAFGECTALENVSCKKFCRLKTIDEDTFLNCTNLHTLDLSQALHFYDFDFQCLNGCTGLKRLILPMSLRNILTLEKLSEKLPNLVVEFLGTKELFLAVSQKTLFVGKARAGFDLVEASPVGFRLQDFFAVECSDGTIPKTSD